MAFTVNFYQFNKQENSTLRPSGTPETFQCQIRRGSGLINPTIELDIGLTTAPIWNYCYIPNFRRYYYVNEWYNDNALWIASLSCDVLATYRGEIGGADLYALRSSAIWDGRIQDNLYPTKVNSNFDSSVVANPWNTIANGCFIIGAVAKQSMYGTVNYYVVNRTAMNDIVQGLIDNTVTAENGFNTTDASIGLQLALVDPLQYIKSAVFIPVSYSDVSGVPLPLGIIPIFNYPINTSGSVKFILDQPYLTISRTFTCKKHPQTNSRGNFVNAKPYTNATLIFPPFGTIELDTTVLCDIDTFNVEVKVDTTTGLGILEVVAHGIVLNRVESQVGVPVQLSQVTRDYIGGVTSAIGGILGTVGSVVTGNIGGAIMSATSGIGNAMNSMVPRSQSIGSGGSYAQLYEAPRVDFQFFEIVDDDIEKNGRPCCQIVNCQDRTGYYLIQDGDVAINGTKEEASQIRSFLESGFYWE